MAKALSPTREPGVSLAAVNDPAPLMKLTYLLCGDTVYGRYEKRVESAII